MICKLAPGFGAWAREPLLHRFPELKMPVTVLIGDIDFMTWDGLPELHEAGKLLPGSSIAIVPDSGHQIQCDNPEFTAKHIMNFVFGPERHEQYKVELQKYLEVRDHQYQKMSFDLIVNTFSFIESGGEDQTNNGVTNEVDDEDMVETFVQEEEG